ASAQGQTGRWPRPALRVQPAAVMVMRRGMRVSRWRGLRNARARWKPAARTAQPTCMPLPLRRWSCWARWWLPRPADLLHKKSDHGPLFYDAADLFGLDAGFPDGFGVLGLPGFDERGKFFRSAACRISRCISGCAV